MQSTPLREAKSIQLRVVDGTPSNLKQFILNSYITDYFPLKTHEQVYFYTTGNNGGFFKKNSVGKKTKVRVVHTNPPDVTVLVTGRTEILLDGVSVGRRGTSLSLSPLKVQQPLAVPASNQEEAELCNALKYVDLDDMCQYIQSKTGKQVAVNTPRKEVEAQYIEAAKAAHSQAVLGSQKERKDVSETTPSTTDEAVSRYFQQSMCIEQGVSLPSLASFPSISKKRNGYHEDSLNMSQRHGAMGHHIQGIAGPPAPSLSPFAEDAGPSAPLDIYLASIYKHVGIQPPIESERQQSAFSSGALTSRKTQEINFRDFQSIKLLGEGGFGRVYLMKYLKTKVAVKFLIEEKDFSHPLLPDDDDPLLKPLTEKQLHKLKEEASLMEAMRHNKIVQFYGICVNPPAIVTEYMERGSMLDVIRLAKANPLEAKKLTWMRRVRMLKDAAEGLVYMHNSPHGTILHRDLKTPNLLVDKNYSVKIADFNLSRLIEEAELTSSRQTTSIAELNPRWLAPEVLEGKHPIKASDVYSFGIVMWEMLTYKLPWAQLSMYAIPGRVREGERPPILDMASIPGANEPAASVVIPEYVALMKHCWAQNPKDRPCIETVCDRLDFILRVAWRDVRTQGSVSSDGRSSDGF